jgi:hypothetical protein
MSDKPIDQSVQPRIVTPEMQANIVRGVRSVPGMIPAEAHAVAIERLIEAMMMCSTIRREAGQAYTIALKIACVSAGFGAHGPAVEKLMHAALRRLETHLATVQEQVNPTPPSAA